MLVRIVSTTSQLGSYANGFHVFLKAKKKRFQSITTVKTLNIGTPRPATVVVLIIKQFNLTMK